MGSLLGVQRGLGATYVNRFWRYVRNIHSLFINVLCDKRVSVRKYVYVDYILVSEEAARAVTVAEKFVIDRL
jgi:hypothetical protein